jgi:hypothetical protein
MPKHHVTLPARAFVKKGGDKVEVLEQIPPVVVTPYSERHVGEKMPCGNSNDFVGTSHASAQIPAGVGLL